MLFFCEEGGKCPNRRQHLIVLMGNLKELTQGKLSIAIAPFYEEFSASVSGGIPEKYPGIMVQVVDAFSNYSEELLMNGEVDLALVMLPFHSGTIRYEPLYREQIYLAVPKHSDVCQKLGDRITGTETGRSAEAARGAIYSI
ncbi:MAG: LysR family transcriptional regulator substrate-binding protein [Clostridium sp.]